MPIFVAGRFLQGWGLGAQYAVALGAVASSYPEEHRPRILALLSGAWVLPSLAGPSVAALLASTVGWRWAFAISLPFVALAAVMVVPEFAHLPPSPERAPRVPWRALLLLAAGTALLLSALSTPSGGRSLSGWSGWAP
jgi:MFS family permease